LLPLDALDVPEALGGFVDPACEPRATWPVLLAPAEFVVSRLAAPELEAVDVLLLLCPSRSQFQLEHPAAIANTAIALMPLKVCSDFISCPFIDALGVHHCSRSAGSAGGGHLRASWGRRTTIRNASHADHE